MRLMERRLLIIGYATRESVRSGVARDGTVPVWSAAKFASDNQNTFRQARLSAGRAERAAASRSSRLTRLSQPLKIPTRTPSATEGPRKCAGGGAGRSLALLVLLGGLRCPLKRRLAPGQPPKTPGEKGAHEAPVPFFDERLAMAAAKDALKSRAFNSHTPVPPAHVADRIAIVSACCSLLATGPLP